MGNDPVPSLIGIFVGHLFYFLAEEFSRMQGFDILRTPKFCVDLARLGGAVPATSGLSSTPSGFGSGTSGSSTSSGFRWGRGRTLGSS